ncbi:MAG: ATP-binding protein [Pyrinomonadaceae bacterium]
MNDRESAVRAKTASSADQILQRILDTTRECVLVVDADLRIANCNVPAAVAFGRDEIEIEGMRLSEVIRDLDLHESFRKAIGREVSSDVRLELDRKGKRRFDVHIAPIELNEVRCAIGFFYETTQIDRLEIVRQEFLSNISHELRTPLTSILAFVETLEDGGLNDVKNNLHFLAVIRRNAERMNSLIADILELSLIESGNVSIEIRRVRLSLAVADVFMAISTKASNRGIRLVNNIPDDSTISADPVRLEQMLTNLIDNAIKFNRPEGTVSVDLDRVEQNDVISVTDTGEGILPEHTGRIFERFYRTDRARSRDLGGTGLGLAIVKHLAKLHGGEVSVNSILGTGTTFTIGLPSA